MKFIHLSDLHLGKRVSEISMTDDQAYILTQILDIIDAEHPDAVVIAGDVYDKSVPPAEAVTLFDGFLCRLAERKLPVLIISGNMTLRSGWPLAGGSWRGRASTSPPSITERLSLSLFPTAAAMYTSGCCPL